MRIAPSLAAAPLDRLGDVIRLLDQADADFIHFDFEDGIFVPVMTLGTKILADLRHLTRRPFDVHLMMIQPEWIIPQLVCDGAERILVHLEACPYPRRTLRLIAEAGATAGLALNPVTPLPDLASLRPYLSFIVILTTEPEVPDSVFLPSVLEKVRQGKRLPEAAGLEWVVDGGLNAENLPQAMQAGADTVVIRRSVFRDGDIAGNLARLRAAATGHSQERANEQSSPRPDPA
jgi:ribulose-phosphate 3-epimerase